jgi:hypothetical protein
MGGRTCYATKGGTPCDELTFPSPSKRLRTRNNEFPRIHKFLANGKRPGGHTTEELGHMHQCSRQFFVHDRWLWRCHTQGRHQLVLMKGPQRLSVTRTAHDKLRHRGFYFTLRALDCFWWPSLADDVGCVTFLLDVCPTWTRGVAL